MKKNQYILVLFFAGAAAALAGSLQTRFTTVVIQDLPIGRSTVVQLEDGQKYSVENKSAQTVALQFSAVVPISIEPSAIMYEKIPDIRWITITPVLTNMAPNSAAEATVVVSVPKDKTYANKNYEFWLRAETVGGQFGVALVTRVRFNVVDSPADGAKDPKVEIKEMKPVGTDSSKTSETKK